MKSQEGFFSLFLRRKGKGFTPRTSVAKKGDLPLDLRVALTFVRVTMRMEVRLTMRMEVRVRMEGDEAGLLLRFEIFLVG